MKHTEDRFTGAGGVELYCQGWLPDGEPQAVLMVVHGLAEHSGRYLNLVNYLVPRGYAVCCFDLRGHGKSEGERGYVRRFKDYTDDLNAFYRREKEDFGNTGIFLLGHSMGAVIALDYATQNQNRFNGLVLSSSILRLSNPRSALAILVSHFLSILFPRKGVMRLDAEAISRDKSVVDAYINDPLVYRGYIGARLGVELLEMMRRLPRKVPELKLPVLLLHGTGDQIADPAGSEIIYQQIGSDDKTIKFYTGFYHEVFNDVGHERVLSTLEDWLNRHTRGSFR